MSLDNSTATAVAIQYEKERLRDCLDDQQYDSYDVGYMGGGTEARLLNWLDCGIYVRVG